MISQQVFTEKVDCILCDSEAYDVLKTAQYPSNLSEDNLLNVYSSSSDHVMMDQLVRCKKCELVYLNPRVQSDIILQSYTSAVDPVFIKQNDSRIRTFKRVFKKILKKNRIVPSRAKKVLDIGCAGGAFPKAAHDCGFTAIGIEPSKWMSEFAKNAYGLEIHNGVLSDFALPAQSFDIISLWDVIEHLTNPRETLQQIHSLLKNDGIFIVNYPDYQSMARRLLGFRWPFFLSVHLFYFTPKTIAEFLNSNGFDVVNISPFWQTLELGYVLKRASAYFKLFGWLEKITGALGLSHIPVTYNVGQSLVIAKKR